MTMTTTLPSEASPSADVFQSLEGVCAARGLDALTQRLVELRVFLEDDLSQVERGLGDVGGGDTPAQQSVRHLLDQDGKRLRPICVALAARSGSGFNAAARVYAVAVEMVHNATLLHDDVVDVGDRRRGADAARVIYGNAASIFGGDWLLVDALCRIQAVGQPGVLERMLAVVKEMVIAESLQLARRGKVRSSTADYFSIISGKTAALFRWAMFAGARAGGLDERATSALELYGQKLGVAFQIVDDVLDVAGDPSATGKSMLTDLREGKMTYPLILAMERDPSLAAILEDAMAEDESGIDPQACAKVARAVVAARAGEDSLELATKYCRDAVKCLEVLPHGRARSSLEAVAMSTPRRRK
jgi:octaprenyl-diphosphate synthase